MVAHPRVTLIVPSWKRPYTIPVIVENALQHEWIHEVIVANNDPSRSLRLATDPRVTVVAMGRNLCTYSRFICAEKHASQEIIATQDDDILPHNFEELFDRFLGNGQRSIVAGLARRHYEVEFVHRKTPWLQLGWLSFFHRDWVRVLDRYRDHFGEDDVLIRKADRIFTALYGKHDALVGNFTRLQHQGQEVGRDRNALYRRDDHMRLTEEAMRRVKVVTGGG